MLSVSILIFVSIIHISVYKECKGKQFQEMTDQKKENVEIRCYLQAEYIK